MTLHATREGKNITIHGNTGVDVTVRNSQLHSASVTEHHAHMKYFHGQLGSLIEEADREEREGQVPDADHAS